MTVVRGERESLDSLVRRFSKSMQTAGVLAQARARAAFESPAARRRRKRMATLRRHRRNATVA